MSGFDLIDCARYGELDDVKALIEAGVDVNSVDDQGSTALHKAAANGHLDVVKYLHSKGAKYTPNEGGNTPLHWCVQTKQVSVVEFLLTAYDDAIDVFNHKNVAGKSAVAEAFDNGHSQLAVLLLKHKSAAEEDRKHKEKQSKDQKQEQEEEDDDEDENAGDEKEKEEGPSKYDEIKTVEEAEASVDFMYLKNDLVFDFEAKTPQGELRPITIREIYRTIPTQKIFGERAVEDVTGEHVWASSVLMARHIIDNTQFFKGKKVIELGSGCGLGGVACRLYTESSHVQFSDCPPVTIANTKHNVIKNLSSSSSSSSSSSLLVDTPTYSLCSIDWHDRSTWPSGSFDVVIGSALVYSTAVVEVLTALVDSLVTAKGAFVFVTPAKQNGLLEFLDSMAGIGFEAKLHSPPQRYYDNPLASRSDDDKHIHLNQLNSSEGFSICIFTRKGAHP